MLHCYWRLQPVTLKETIMNITAHRAKQIEATIRRLRNHPDLWGDDEVKSLRITSIITKRKIALCDYYNRTRRDFAGERLLQMYA